jgi:hypothetical protein
LWRELEAERLVTFVITSCIYDGDPKGSYHFDPDRPPLAALLRRLTTLYVP